MQTELQAGSGSKAMIWTGRVVSALAAALMLLDGVMKLVKPPFVVEATTKLGYAESVIVPLGAVVIACTVIYIIPPTAVLGAVLLTGYLGGAVASHVLAGDGPLPIAAPVIFASIVWGGLYLRERRLRALVPWRR